MKHKLATVERSYGPWGYGLAGLDAAGELLLVLIAHPKRGMEWMRRRISPADRRRVEAAVRETYGPEAA